MGPFGLKEIMRRAGQAGPRRNPYETELMVIAPEGAYIVIDDIEVEYGSVDNGHLLYGQENYLTLYLSNVGSDDVENLTIEISSDSEYINMVQGVLAFQVRFFVSESERAVSVRPTGPFFLF